MKTWLPFVALILAIPASELRADDLFVNLLAKGQWLVIEESPNPTLRLLIYTSEQRDAAIATAMAYEDEAAAIRDARQPQQRIPGATGRVKVQTNIKSDLPERMRELARQPRGVPAQQFYQLTHVGDDYIALRRGRLEYYFPLSRLERVARIVSDEESVRRPEPELPDNAATDESTNTPASTSADATASGNEGAPSDRD